MLFDLLTKETLSKVDRERVKQASRSLLESVQKLIAPLERWTDKEQTQAEVEVFILDHVFASLPTPPFTEEGKQSVAKRVYQHVLATKRHAATHCGLRNPRRLGGLTAGVVKLRKPDGTTVTVTMEQLSDGDREWIEARRRERRRE